MNTAPNPTLHMEPLIQHLLESSLHQQLVTQELAWGLQAASQELLQQRARAHPLPHCLPDPCQEAFHLLPKLTRADSIDAYLYTFKQTAIRKGWPEEECAQALAPEYPDADGGMFSAGFTQLRKHLHPDSTLHPAGCSWAQWYCKGHLCAWECTGGGHHQCLSRPPPMLESTMSEVSGS